MKMINIMIMSTLLQKRSTKIVNGILFRKKPKLLKFLIFPLSTAQNMQKLMFYPSGHTLNVPHTVRNMSVLGHFRDITHSYPKPQKPKKSLFRKYFGSPFDLRNFSLPDNYISKSALIKQNSLSGIALR